jgi:hypothetical protein
MSETKDDGLFPFCILLRWGQSDEGEYGYTGRHATEDEAIAAARSEMFWSEKSPEDYPELFDENGNPLPDDDEEVADEIPEYDVIEVNNVNVYAASDALKALRAVWDDFGRDYTGPTMVAVREAIDRLECRNCLR